MRSSYDCWVLVIVLTRPWPSYTQILCIAGVQRIREYVKIPQMRRSTDAESDANDGGHR